MNVKTTQNGQKVKRINYRKRNRNLFFACIVALPVLQFCLCYIYVNINSFVLAFQHYEFAIEGLGFDITFAGLSNFKEAMTLMLDRGHYLKNSLLLFFWTTVIGMTLALLFSYYIYKKYPMGELFRVVLFLPKILSGVVFCLLFKYITGGVYQYIAQTFFHVESPLPLLYNPDTQLATVLFYSVWVSFGVNVLMFSGSMSGIDEAVVESAQLDGTNAVQEFIYITVPMIWPTFVSFLVINFTGLFTDQMHLFTFFGTSSDDTISTFGYYLYLNSANGELINLGGKTPVFSVQAAMGLLITVVMLPLTLGLRKGLRKFGPSVD